MEERMDKKGQKDTMNRDLHDKIDSVLNSSGTSGTDKRQRPGLMMIRPH